jgi:hypothetical protein
MWKKIYSIVCEWKFIKWNENIKCIENYIIENKINIKSISEEEKISII